METTNAAAAEIRNDNQQTPNTPYCAGERCAQCPHGDTCQSYLATAPHALEERRAKIERSAAYCPPEHRATYAYLLENTHREAYQYWTDNPYPEDEENPVIFDQNQKANAEAAAELAAITVLVNAPELDPALLAEVFDALDRIFSCAGRFSERLRMLGELRAPRAEITANN